MAIKKPYTIRRMDPQEAPQLDENFRGLYENKVESRVTLDNGTFKELTYQCMESGQDAFTATGSATITKTFSFQGKFDTVVRPTVVARSSEITAHVTAVTRTSITITIRDADGTTNVSSITSGCSITVFYDVLGSIP